MAREGGETVLHVPTPCGAVRCVLSGAGAPVLLVHGLAGSARWWTPTVDRLAPRFRCCAVELVGFGGWRRGWREEDRVPLRAAAQALLTVLDALGWERADLVAHSLGAHPALALAAAHPERIGRLVLIAPAVAPGIGRWPGVRSLAGSLARRGRFLPLVAPRFAAVLARDAVRTGPGRWLRAVRELATAAAPPFARVAAPTLLVWGDRDPLVSPALAPVLQRLLPGSRLLLLPGARHVPMYERPAACNDAIAAFLSGAPVGLPATADAAREAVRQ